MKILVVCQHYWPEPYPLTDLCEQLAGAGHTVHVLTDLPNYPMGYVFPEYRNGKRRIEVHNGVKIIRCFTIGRRNNILFRILNYYSYAISSAIKALGLKEDYDAVLSYQTSPIMMMQAALSFAKRHHKKCVVYCLDLWPASLAAGGVQENSLIYRLFHRISHKLYNQADRILISSKMFRSYLESQFGISDMRIGYLPQYADAAFDTVTPPQQHEGYDFVFAGNIGAAQSLDTILKAAQILQEEAQIRWHIVGDGSELENLIAISKSLNLDNVIFHGRKPIEQMPQYYSMADAMLVTLTADPYISLTLPRKVQTYMAAGKPVLAAANGEIPLVIADARCGYCAPAEDVDGFVNCIRSFIANDDKAQLGQNGRKYYQENFTAEMFMDNLMNELKTFSDNTEVS